MQLPLARAINDTSNKKRNGELNMTNKICLVLGAVICAATSTAATAQLKIGITVSQTGPAAALGIPQKNTVAQLPKEIAVSRAN